ncbi:PREDICTED: uncharacterized protein LOC100631605 [Amphimedon queenslandica]|uniref:Uncharacterized protein n=1 Tax=Amphimedon queenslandica TaxID=400682 RepID=A0A1X7VI91_AMPQE|nr:PREDICTED: uncharacterized protein LOC100631605 [Amphimedon queenslandica]|eukprot:XP_003384333.1 PREDICTED: uncharacterized protein LOC100631605 [Amphimedon queenslandica]
MNFELAFEEVDEELVTMGDEMSAGLNVDLETEEAMSEESWASGNKLKVNLVESMEMADEIGNGISNDVISEEKLTADFAKDVSKELFGPENPAEVAEEIPKSLYEASVKISQLQNETEAAELAEKSGSKFSKLKMVGKVLAYGTGIVMGLDWLAGKLANIVEVCIDSDDPPDWANQLTANEKDDMKHLGDAVSTLQNTIQSWTQQWSTYKDQLTDLGTVTVTINSTAHSIPVMYMLFYAFSDMRGVINNAQTALSADVGNLNVAAVIVATNNVFMAFADALAVFKIKEKSNGLQIQDFPPQNDNVTINNAISTFRNGRARVNAVGVKYTRFASTNAITAYLQVRIIRDIYSSMQTVVLPAMKDAAKEAFKSAAQDHMDSVKAKIRAEAFIPAVGPEKAREMLKSEQAKAAQLGTTAAQTAAEKVLRERRPQVVANAKAEVKKYAQVDQVQLRKIADFAVDSAMGQVKTAVSTK